METTTVPKLPPHITTLNLPPSETMATNFALPPGVYFVGTEVDDVDKEIANPGGDNMQLYLENKIQGGHESHKVCLFHCIHGVGFYLLCSG